MIFDDIIGNEDVKKALTGMVDSGRIPHAIMLYENDGCGAMEFALAFLEYLTGSKKLSKLIHPDVHFVYPVSKGSKVSTDKPNSESYLHLWRELVIQNPFFTENDLSDAFGIEGKSSLIAVSEAKNILDKLSLSSLEGGYKAVVIYLPEKMNTETANRLLKSIEEPPELTQFIFITHAPEKVLTTISSRCQGIRIIPLQKDELVSVLTQRFGKSFQEACAASEIAGGSVGKALSWLSDSDSSVAESELFYELMDSLLSKNLFGALEVADNIAALPSREKAKSFCQYMANALRKIFMLQQGLPMLAGVTEGEKERFSGYASRLRKTFPRMACAQLDRARMLIDRNINLKIMFCDLVDRLYTFI